MSDKLSEVQAHISSVRSLESVVSAMRGIAAARSVEARKHLDGIRACAAIIGSAIGDALMLDVSEATGGDEEDTVRVAGAELLIVFCAEQGFVGTFNERVVANAAEGAMPGAACFLVGGRGTASAARHYLDIVWSASMVAHAEEVPPLADRITRALYQRMHDHPPGRVTLVYATPNTGGTIDIAKHALLPFDFGLFARPTRRVPPIVTMSPRRLLAKLAEEYVYAPLCEAIMLSFAAENEARMRAMIAARTNVRKSLDELLGDFRRLRQEEITSEIVELSAGSLAAQGETMRARKRLAAPRG